jgi:hypothetical protein
MQRKFCATAARFGAWLCLSLLPTWHFANAESGDWRDGAGDQSLLIASRQLPEASKEHSDVVPEGDLAPEGELESLYCPGNCCNLCPCSYIVVEGLILGRDNQSGDQPLVIDLNTDEELLDSGDLDFDWAGGVRAYYGRRVCGCLSLELGYLGVFDNSAADGVALDDSLMLPDDLGLQVNNFFGADTVNVRYASDLHSFEANAVCCCCGCNCAGVPRSIEWLTGFRYLNFDETFGISSFDDAEGTTLYEVETDNHLYGGQVGSRYRACHGRWSWEATGKAGLFANDMEQTQDPIVDFPNFVFRDGQRGSDTDVAFVGDLNLTAIYQLNQVWGARLGYNLIWLEGVALAADQVDFTNTPDSGSDLRDGGGVFLHGVSTGVEARW